MAKNNKKAQDYFERHQGSNECHISSDGRVFHTKGSAESFAVTLEDRTVESFTRKSMESKDKANDKSSDKDKDKTGDIDVEALVALKTKELQETELVKENYKAIQGLVKYFQIEVENQKAETLIAALTEYKLKLQA